MRDELVDSTSISGCCILDSSFAELAPARAAARSVARRATRGRFTGSTASNPSRFELTRELQNYCPLCSLSSKH
jgi:hypothetical protein